MRAIVPVRASKIQEPIGISNEFLAMTATLSSL